MFSKMKNIDTAFRHVRTFTLVIIIGCVVITSLALFKSYALVGEMQQKVYILANGKAIEAFASDRKENIPVEARDHVASFHHFFFTMDPDEKVIRDNVTRALYLADDSAKRVYDDLTENGYYAGIISGNISQTLKVDSIRIDTDHYPYGFRCYAMQQIIRPTTVSYRSLVTQGSLRNVSRSDHNPHGFLIERWSTLENSDIRTQNRD